MAKHEPYISVVSFFLRLLKEAILLVIVLDLTIFHKLY